MKLKVTLTHTSTAPFVQQVGRALYEQGMLKKFATTFVDRPGASWRKGACAVGGFMGRDLGKQLRRRAVTEVPESLVVSYPWREIVRTGVGKIDRDQRLTDFIWEWAETGFDRWAARHALGGANAVYCFEHVALASFAAAKARGMARIYDVPAPEHEFTNEILRREMEPYPELVTPYQSYIEQHQERRTERRRQEWALADVVIANSQFTKNSYAASGLDVEKVQVVPYGAPPVNEAGRSGGSEDDEPMRFLWAGTFNIRKGAHHLLRAWRMLKPGAHARLNVYGAMMLPDSLRAGLPDTINFSGTVPHSELFGHYQRADALVFPTLCDGFGMVATEAFAQGLPVITTNRAGAADLVRQGVNGMIVAPGDAEQLAEALDWCITHRRDLRSMRGAALATAAGWQWTDYRRALVEGVLSGLGKAGFDT